MLLYKANAANTRAAMTLPEIEVRTPELAVSGVAEAEALNVALLAPVTGGATRRVVGMLVAVVLAGTVAGAVPCTSPTELETVTNATSGRVMAVLIMMIAELDGIADPAFVSVDCVTAYVIVVKSCTVVDGPAVVVPAPVAGETERDDAPVIMAGLEGIYAAQIPWK